MTYALMFTYKGDDTTFNVDARSLNQAIAKAQEKLGPKWRYVPPQTGE